ncbi:hypothetical protein VB773_14215 [Haloarculaceae archaeon H-GB2-1]|nr:hypothetical protein [Haloarculaceae archaeon H-GB1-1]MEA5408610.1 hypothetical protein [Haloarculaceae archaeon H-GB2-1]
MSPGISGRDPFKLLERTNSIIKSQGWTGVGKSAIGTVLLAVVFGGIDVFNAVLSVPIAILEALGVSVASLNRGVFVGLGDFFGSVLGATAGSFGSGWTGLLGPFQGPLGMAVFLFMLWEILYFMDLVDTDVLGLAIDFPDILLNSDSTDVADDIEDE